MFSYPVCRNCPPVGPPTVTLKEKEKFPAIVARVK